MAEQQQHQGVIMRDYRKGNWTVSETMVLIEAKRMDDERRMKRTNGGGKPTELRWKWVEDYCWRKGCMRSQNQCNDKWDNLMRDYKKVRDYERKKILEAERGEGDGDGDGSYWKLEKNERKERNLPSNLLFQIYEALVEVVERRGGSGSSGGVGTSVTRASHLMEIPSQVSMAPPPHLLMQHQVSSATPPSQVMPLLPPPPIPPSHPPPHPSGMLPCSLNPWSHPLPSVDSEDTSDAAEYSGSPAKRRRRGNNGGEGTSTGGGGNRGGSRSPSSHHDHDDHDQQHQVGNAISRSASIIAEAIHGCEEREERRHRDLMALHERRLRVEESKTEITKQGINGLVDAINNLATSILSLASSNSNKNQPSSS